MTRTCVYLVPWFDRDGVTPYPGPDIYVMLHPTVALEHQLENMAYILRRRRHREVLELPVEV